jgi:hypothetical protein
MKPEPYEIWVTVLDQHVRHVWKDPSGNEHFVGPDFYGQNGTPVDDETGDDMEYVRTELLACAFHGKD